ncbi:MAG TPA: chloride channel protein [Gemmatimonadaceae bacterium]|nr:chloride channel protein [Gemmatimonadaceae bacterium]
MPSPSPRLPARRWRLDRLLRLVARGRRALAERFHRVASSDEAVLLILSVPVGALTALGVLAFYRGISAAHALFLVAPATLLPPLGLLALRPVVIAAAFAAASAVMRHLGHDHDGMNVPDIIRAVASRGGRIPVRPAVARTIASAITIGGGGSAGSEGPLVVGGAGVGSWVARLFRVDASVTRVLAGCGTAAAIAAAFNAPLAGAFFALEEVLGAFSGASFSPVVVASVVSVVVSRGLFGSAPAFPVPSTLGGPDLLEIWVLLPVLGAICALASALYVRTYFAAEDVARSSKVPRWARPLIGGVVVGLLLFGSRGALAGDIHLAAPLDLFGALPWWTLFALAAGKILATSVTLNFGGSGGVFTPSLFVGAATGGAFGSLCAQLLPGRGIDPALYSVAGMGALVAGATGAPITGILLVFEMTNDFTLVLPLMLAVVSCKTLMRRLERDSLYSGWLRRRGAAAEVPDLSMRTVGDVLDPAPATLRESTTVAQALSLLGRQPQSVLPVVDAEGRYIGVVTPMALGEAMRDAPQLATTLIAADLATAVDPLTPDASLAEAATRFRATPHEAIPVVGASDGHLLGLVSRAHLLASYEQALRAAQDPLRAPP